MVVVGVCVAVLVWLLVRVLFGLLKVVWWLLAVAMQSGCWAGCCWNLPCHDAGAI